MKAKIIVTLFAVSLFLLPELFGQAVHKFSDPVLRHIHDLADRRDGDSLLFYLNHDDMNYRGEALLCFGSLQLPQTADTIFRSMQNAPDGVRMMGAFALGQIQHPVAVPFILEALKTEEKGLVRGMLYDALGKCGDAANLDWMAEQPVTIEDSEGMAMGLLRFGLRRITSLKGNLKTVEIMQSGGSFTAKTYASYYLGRYAGMDWLQTEPASILSLYQNERDATIRSNLVKAVIRAMDEEAWLMVKGILESDDDYRVKVNILGSMALIPWNKAMSLVYALATGEDPTLSVAAAEAIAQFAVYTDLQVLLKSIDRCSHWRSRSLMLGKALELVWGKASLVSRVEKMILESIAAAKEPTERAWYLKALIHNPGRYAVAEEMLSNAKSPVEATYAVETLTEMRKREHFGVVAAEMAKSGIDLDAEYLRIFSMAIRSGDVPLVALAAGILREPALGYRERITDTGFLQQALARMNHPSKSEAFVELVKTLAWLQGAEAELPGAPEYNHPIDWERVVSIPARQKVAVVTTRGEFLVQLNVNWCPGTVAGFMELVDQGFYENGTIHRVVPNFVMQDGCPRGDGWGGPEFTVRSEFTPVPFLEGTFGMASSGRDTEGSQWYATHSPTPHLDGRYTNFGTVIAGMEVVHALQVGDKILKIERIGE